MKFPGLLLNDLLLMRKSRAFVLLLFLLPLILALISTITSESGGYTDLKIAIVNEDKTFIGLFFLQYATSMLKGENIVQLSSRDQIDGVLEDLDGVFIIPRGFANKLLFQEPSECMTRGIRLMVRDELGAVLVRNPVSREPGLEDQDGRLGRRVR